MAKVLQRSPFYILISFRKPQEWWSYGLAKIQPVCKLAGFRTSGNESMTAFVYMCVVAPRAARARKVVPRASLPSPACSALSSSKVPSSSHAAQQPREGANALGAPAPRRMCQAATTGAAWQP